MGEMVKSSVWLVVIPNGDGTLDLRFDNKTLVERYLPVPGEDLMIEVEMTLADVRLTAQSYRRTTIEVEGGDNQDLPSE